MLNLELQFQLYGKSLILYALPILVNEKAMLVFYNLCNEELESFSFKLSNFPLSFSNSFEVKKFQFFTGLLAFDKCNYF